MMIKLYEDVGVDFDFGIAVDFLFSEPDWPDLGIVADDVGM